VEGQVVVILAHVPALAPVALVLVPVVAGKPYLC